MLLQIIRKFGSLQGNDLNSGYAATAQRRVRVNWNRSSARDRQGNPIDPAEFRRTRGRCATLEWSVRQD